MIHKPALGWLAGCAVALAIVLLAPGDNTLEAILLGVGLGLLGAFVGEAAS